MVLATGCVVIGWPLLRNDAGSPILMFIISNLILQISSCCVGLQFFQVVHFLLSVVIHVPKVTATKTKNFSSSNFVMYLFITNLHSLLDMTWLITLWSFMPPCCPIADDQVQVNSTNSTNSFYLSARIRKMSERTYQQVCQQCQHIQREKHVRIYLNRNCQDVTATFIMNLTSPISFHWSESYNEHPLK